MDGPKQKGQLTKSLASSIHPPPFIIDSHLLVAVAVLSLENEQMHRNRKHRNKYAGNELQLRCMCFAIRSIEFPLLIWEKLLLPHIITTIRIISNLREAATLDKVLNKNSLAVNNNEQSMSSSDNYRWKFRTPRADGNAHLIHQALYNNYLRFDLVSALFLILKCCYKSNQPAQLYCTKKTLQKKDTNGCKRKIWTNFKGS